LETLVMQYQVQAVRVANMIVHDRSRAEDIVQGVFIRVYRQIDTFDASRPFRPWFIRLVVNEALRVTTGRIDLSFETPLFDGSDGSVGDLLPDQQLGPEGEAEAAEMRQLIWEALGDAFERIAVVAQKVVATRCSVSLDLEPGVVETSTIGTFVKR
jgi:RNA polymerase sigma-70 factor (ECF subfamily)